MHPEEWAQNQLLQLFLDVGRILILPIEFAWKKLDAVVSIGSNGKFGLQLITLGFVLIYVSIPSKTLQNIDYYKSIYSVSKMIVVAIVIWLWLLQLIEDKDLFEGMFYYIIVFAILLFFREITGLVV